jgi:hypothetical protein
MTGLLNCRQFDHIRWVQALLWNDCVSDESDAAGRIKEYSMNENLDALEPGQDYLHETSEGPPRDPPSDPNEAEVHTSDEAPQQNTDTSADPVSGSPDELVNDEEL